MDVTLVSMAAPVRRDARRGSCPTEVGEALAGWTRAKSRFTRAESSWSTERVRMAALARRWVGNGMSMTLGDGSQYTVGRCRYNGASHNEQGNSCVADMMLHKSRISCGYSVVLCIKSPDVLLNS